MTENDVLMYIYKCGGNAVVEEVVSHFGKDVLGVLEVLRGDGWVAEEDGVFRLTGEVTSTLVGSYGDITCLMFHAPMSAQVGPSGPQG